MEYYNECKDKFISSDDRDNFIVPEIFRNTDFYLDCLREKPSILWKIPKNFLNEEMLELILDIAAYKYKSFPDRLKYNKNINYSYILQYPSGLRYIPKDARTRNIVLTALSLARNKNAVVKYIPQNIWDDELALSVLEYGGFKNINYIPEHIFIKPLLFKKMLHAVGGEPRAVKKINSIIIKYKHLKWFLI